MDAKPSYFFILGMPGTDKPWLANFLTYARSICYINPSQHFESIDNLPKLFEISRKPFQGAADSLLTLFHQEIQETFDAPPIVLIDRDYRDMMPLGVGETIVTEAIRREFAKVKQYDNCLTVQFADLANEATCKRIWEHCLPGEKHNSLRWAVLSDLIVEANMAKLHKLVGTNLGKLSKFLAPALERVA